MAAANKKALVLLADGFEEVEAVTPVDYLRRAGVEVVTASVSESLTVTGKWGGVKITAGAVLDKLTKQETDGFDAVIVPGGMPGSANIAASAKACALLKEAAASGKLVCAICAAPAVVLAPLGLLNGRKFTCYPEMEKEAQQACAGKCEWTDERVAVDGNVITSRAAGTAGEFAIEIIKRLTDEETARKIARTVLL